MDAPLGSCVGNALEVMEAIQILRGEKKDKLYDTCIFLTANMLELAGKGSYDKCAEMAQKAISSGKALEIFRKTVELHGGDPHICDDTSLLPQPVFSHELRASRDVEIISVNSEEIGMASLLLGAGRISKDDQVDLSAGIEMHCAPGDKISMDAPLMTLHSSVCSDFSEAAVRAMKAIRFRDI